MNASYKIVLLAAFVLFAAVVGYYVFVPDGENAQASDDNKLAGQTPDGPDQPAGNSADDDTGTDSTTNTNRAERTPPTPEGPGRRPAPGTAADDNDNTVVIRPPLGDPLDIRVRDEVTGDETTQDTATGETGTDRVALGGTDDETGTLPGARRGPGPAGSGTGDNAGGDTDTGAGEIRRGPGATGDDTADTGTGTPGGPTPDPSDGETASETSAGTSDTRTAEPDTDTGTDTAAEPRRPTPRPTTARRYAVQPGDTFASIAIEVYGEERAWFEIAQANPSVDPKRLQVGQVIVLPDLDAAEREREEAAPPAPGKDESYTVRPGDTLSGIAQKFYGDSEAWDLIYNRNRDKIGPSPDALKTGMELVIPQAYSGAE
jgi:nucleoid-associated protein YgaU